jgi:ABC-type multidrug transport system ATPase subunit
VIVVVFFIFTFIFVIGKTTLLKCLIGILPIDNGNIVVFGTKTDQNYCSYRMNLSKLGFMPQVT